MEETKFVRLCYLLILTWRGKRTIRSMQGVFDLHNLAASTAHPAVIAVIIVFQVSSLLCFVLECF